MQLLSRILSRNPPSTYSNLPKYLNLFQNPRFFSSTTVGGGDDFAWGDSPSSWSTGLTKDHFDGDAVGRQVTPSHQPSPGGGGGGIRGGGGGGGTGPSGLVTHLKETSERQERERKMMEDEWEAKEREVCELLKQIEEPGTRGSYLKDSEKAEMYKKHKENPEENTVEKLAREYRIMRQRVLAILWLKELEEEEEKKRGEPLDDSVELLLDTFPE